MALVFVMILHWLKKAAISNFLEDHAPKLEQFVFICVHLFPYLLELRNVISKGHGNKLNFNDPTRVQLAWVPMVPWNFI